MIKIPFSSSSLIAPILLGHRYPSSPSSSPPSRPCRPSPYIIFPLFQSHPSPPLILSFFSSSSSSFNPTLLLLLQSHLSPLLLDPPIPSFFSSSSSFLYPLQLLPSSIIDVPPPYSFSLLPFLLTPFSSLFSSFSFSLLLQSHPSPPLLPPPPPIIPPFSSSSSNPTNRAFNTTLHLYTNFRNPALPLHPFLIGDPSFPPPLSPHPLLLLVVLLLPLSHSFNPTFLLLFFFLL